RTALSGRQAAAGTATLPLRHVGGRGIARLGNGDSVRDAGRHPRVGVDLTTGGGDEQDAASPGLTVLAPVHEVPEPVGDKGSPDLADAEHPVGVAADDD